MFSRFLFRGESSSNSKWNIFVAPFRTLSSVACTHPVHTIVAISFLASAAYFHILDDSFSAIAGGKGGFIDLGFGRKSVILEEGRWKEVGRGSGVEEQAQYGLITLQFPTATKLQLPDPSPHSAATLVTSNRKNDNALIYSVPYEKIGDFANSILEIMPSESRDSGKWVMAGNRDIRFEGTQSILQAGVMGTIKQACKSFWNLLTAADPFDILIMTVAYLCMYITFGSLFFSMRRLGSRFWLFGTVIFSSTMAFMFATWTTHKLGVPITMILLSEGLPFLVITIGFEKPIILTRAVLEESFKTKTAGTGAQFAVDKAVREKGLVILRDYLVEIGLLALGAFSGVQGGLRQFCFLSAWILFYDCILLFTFYTAILSIKLEINRIKRHVALKKALEEDGVSKRVAENVARSSEWPNNLVDDRHMVFGKHFKERGISQFKIYMVIGFVLVNLLNLVYLPRGWKNGRFYGKKVADNFGDMPPFATVVGYEELDVKTVAGDALDNLTLIMEEGTVLTILRPVEYVYVERGKPSPLVILVPPVDDSAATAQDEPLTDAGAQVLEGFLKSLENPTLSKWAVVALAFSVVLNGYLFNAVRWSTLKEPGEDYYGQKPEKEQKPAVVEKIVYKNCPCGGKGIKNESIDSSDEEGLMMKPKCIAVQPMRPLDECLKLLEQKRGSELTDEEAIDLSLRGKIPGYALEKTLADATRAVKVRRAVISRMPANATLTSKLENSLLPWKNFDYARVLGACCENVVGYLPLPLGLAGPLTIDGESFFVPMATTEGVLVASTSRGCKAINAGGGITTVMTGDGMTRGPCVSFPTLREAGAAKLWLDSDDGQEVVKNAFNSTSRFARLQTIKTALAGNLLFIRFRTTTGDAMGMNMISKGVEHALHVMATECGFDNMSIVSVSGNYCTDKKPAAINWIDGRGKGVVAEATIPATVVKSVLKSDVDALVELNINKNLIGSAMAGSVGGFNAHAANVVTALFIATGQDPAQNVESSNCITIMKKNCSGDLQISVSMPSIEVGTIGGGTILEPQGAMLELLGVRGAHPTNPGDNSRKLARVVASAVLAGELSLCSALAAGHLVKSHMAHNRSQPATRTSTPAPPSNSPPVPVITAELSMTKRG